MSKWMQQAVMAGAALALIGTTACTTLEASSGYGDAGAAAQSSRDDILQRMAADSQGG
ncbi:MAG TPA: hypothetical protein VN782_07700 [Usitatibacter sp.]|nr:hypothetical protein [Usitatibacter sp.]